MSYPNTIPAGTLVIPGGGVTVNNNPNNPQTYDQLTLAQSNLAFYYPLNDTSGTPVDKTGNTTIVSTSGNPVLQAAGGTIDGATGVQFPNGSGYTLNVAGVDTTKRFSYDFIISLPDINADRNFFELGQQYNAFVSTGGPNTPNFGMYVYGANTSYNSYGKFDALNTFVHIGGTYDPVSETAIVWVNGQRYTSFYAPRSTASLGPTCFPLINSSVGINNGVMQKFAVYSGALNDSYFEAKARAAFYQPTTVLTGQILSTSNLYPTALTFTNPHFSGQVSATASDGSYTLIGTSSAGYIDSDQTFTPGLSGVLIVDLVWSYQSFSPNGNQVVGLYVTNGPLYSTSNAYGGLLTNYNGGDGQLRIGTGFGNRVFDSRNPLQSSVPLFHQKMKVWPISSTVTMYECQAQDQLFTWVDTSSGNLTGPLSVGFNADAGSTAYTIYRFNAYIESRVKGPIL